MRCYCDVVLCLVALSGCLGAVGQAMRPGGVYTAVFIVEERTVIDFHKMVSDLVFQPREGVCYWRRQVTMFCGRLSRPCL